MTAILCGIIAALSFSHEFGLGADYSDQRYYIAEEDTEHILRPTLTDTLDYETEARGFWNLSLTAQPLDSDILAGPATSFDADNNLSFSTRSLRDRLNLAFGHNLSDRLGLEVANETDVRYYHRSFPSITDTTYSRNHIGNAASLALDLDLTDATTISLSEELELLHYPEPDSFNQDNLDNRLGTTLRQELSMLSALTVDYDWSRHLSAGTEDEQYSGHEAGLDFDWYIDNGPHFELDNTVSRRAYSGGGHSYWEVSPSITLDHDFSDRWAASISDDARATWYDAVTSTYVNTTENSLRLLLELRPSTELTVRLGPQFDQQRGLKKPGSDDYRERSLVLGVDLLKTDRFWLSAEDRLGRRQYTQTDSGYQTDYAFNELSLLANWTILSGPSGALSAEGMVSLSPEWHTARADNFTTRIYTLELKYGR